MKRLPFQSGRSKVSELSTTKITAIYVVCLLTVLGRLNYGQTHTQGNFSRVPKNVTNFTCHSINWEVLNCSWVKPNNIEPTNYTLHYSLEEKGDSLMYRCPTDDDIRYNGCEWTTDSVPPYRRTYRNYTMYISGSNSFGQSKQEIRVDTFERMKLNPPQDLECVNKTTKSHLLSYKMGTLLVYEESILYKVQYAVAIESSENWTTTCNYSNGNALVAGNWTLPLYPCQNGTIKMDEDKMFLNVSVPYAGANYIFNVSVKVGFAPEGHWSQPATITC